MIQDIGEGVFSNAFSLEPAYEGAPLYIYRGNDILVKGDEHAPELPTYGELTPACHHLFFMEGKGCYINEEILSTPEGFRYVNAPALARSHPDRKIAFSVITGLQLSRWEQSRKFCGRCGAPTVRSEVERAMVCPKCGQLEYPKICPATITAITHNGKLLLARGKNSPPGRYGLIAGFCEIGETFEETVKREALEEVGIKVKNVTYFKNQPWGFSDSQMIGFFAELDGDDETLCLQESELAEAHWFTPEEVPHPANDISIFSEIVWKFLTDHGIERK